MKRESVATRGLHVVLSLLTALVVVVTALQVLFRYVFLRPLHWTDEAARYLFVWMTFLGGAVAVERKAHVAVEYFVEKLPRGLRLFAAIVTNVAATGFLLTVFVYGVKLLRVASDQPSAMIGMPMTIPYGAIPVGAFLMLTYFVCSAIRDFRSAPARSRAEDVGEVEGGTL